eukprot:COSAG02_NODE_1467_length_12482_cov_6.138577_3_plen_62_part_00
MANSVNCPNLPRFQILLSQVERMCADEDDGTAIDENSGDVEMAVTAVRRCQSTQSNPKLRL